MQKLEQEELTFKFECFHFHYFYSLLKVVYILNKVATLRHVPDQNLVKQIVGYAFLVTVKVPERVRFGHENVQFSHCVINYNLIHRQPHQTTLVPKWRISIPLQLL